MRGSEKFLRGFNMPAIRRAEIERYACAIDAAVSYGADRPFLSGSVISQDLPNGFKVRGCLSCRKTSKRALESQD
jgi:hypothetical protein